MVSSICQISLQDRYPCLHYINGASHGHYISHSHVFVHVIYHKSRHVFNTVWVWCGFVCHVKKIHTKNVRYELNYSCESLLLFNISLHQDSLFQISWCNGCSWDEHQYFLVFCLLMLSPLENKRVWIWIWIWSSQIMALYAYKSSIWFKYRVKIMWFIQGRTRGWSDQ